MAFTEGTEYYLRSALNGQYLNVYGTVGGNSKEVDTYPKSVGDPTQIWVLRHDGTGADYALYTKLSGGNTYALNRVSSTNTNCNIYTAAGNDDRYINLFIQDTASNTYKIKEAHYGGYLTVSGTDSYGRPDVQWLPNVNNSSQIWYVEPVSGGTTPTNPPTGGKNLGDPVDGAYPPGFVAGSDNYTTPPNPFANGQCTWFAWGRTREVFDINVHFDITSGRDGDKWFEHVDNARKKVAKGGSLAVGDRGIISWKRDNGSAGHVAFIEKYDGQYIWMSQANKDGNETVNTVIKREVPQIENYVSNGDLLGYIIF